ncbi:DUF3152 domain-containing protein [Streptomyces sp. NPDC047017]|uniref:DUF3152 domain-containing protein n=1 Tax=Streptomyces sp. NPDC047017 TaxID=3155024 RepID=UPI0034030AA6
MPGTTPPAASRRTIATRRRRARRRRRIYFLCALAAAGSLGAAALLTGAGRQPDGGGTTASGGRSPAATRGSGHTESADVTRRADGGSPTPSPGRSGKGKGLPTSSPKPGNGVFHIAQASGRVAGSGTVRRYEVQVEEGTGVSPDAAAQEIAGILADPRSWTADGHDAFQLVSQGPVDFVVKIATPGTVDRLCGAAGLHTHGEVNCDVGEQVLVNLKRWNLGSPQFPGPIHEYRALIVNHEVGHRIGHGHETCPGPGRPAPAMMQQIDGLHGCVPNAWPYDAKGHYLSGPPVP